MKSKKKYQQMFATRLQQIEMLWVDRMQIYKLDINQQSLWSP